jgi:hypothetical protein
MKKRVAALLAVLGAACSNDTMGPTAVPERLTVAAQEGQVTSSAIAVERVRLRFANGADIATSLVNGQVIEVPVNVRLDVWAEIRRLETDGARLTVNWGDGAGQQGTGCGSCRLENTYFREGEFPVNIRIVDLNAPTATSVILNITITLKVVDPVRLGTVEGLTCAAVSENFNSIPLFTSLPITRTGMKFEATSSINSTASRVGLVVGTFDNFSTRALFPLGDLVITFDSDKNNASIAVAGLFSSLISQEVTIKAYSAGGAEVASVSRTPTDRGGPLNTWREDVMTVSGPTFRSLRISSDHFLPSTFAVDNLQASCK